jgi:16S rRNA (cytosine1402-N4)-methyltransferase
VILPDILPDGRYVGLDWDPEILRAAEEKLRPFGSTVTLLRADYSALGDIPLLQELSPFQCVLFDLGVSTLQLESPNRGFSFQTDGPLDMRMNPDIAEDAARLLRRAREVDLVRILREYGEERYAKRIARAVVARRRRSPIRSTRELAELIEKTVPRRERRIHPATRSFQALRIAVNRELENLRCGISAALGRLSVGGRIAVLSFHSLEDRIVKNLFRDQARLGRLTLITKKPMRPAPEEVRANRRSRSARLRVAEKSVEGGTAP